MTQSFEYKLTEYLSKFFKFSTSDGILRKQDAIQTKGILIPNTYFE